MSQPRPLTDLVHLRDLANEAPAGPWEFGCGTAEWHVTTEGEDCETLATTPYGEVGTYIAAVNPTVVLGLIDIVEQARAYVAHGRGSGYAALRAILNPQHYDGQVHDE